MFASLRRVAFRPLDALLRVATIRRTQRWTRIGAIASGSVLCLSIGCAGGFASAASTCSSENEEVLRAEPDGTLPKLFVQQLQNIVGEEFVTLDEEELCSHGEPPNSYHRCGRLPDVVVSPNTTEEVSAIVRLCADHKVAVIPYGGATSVEGQLLAPQGGVSLDFRRMNKILRLSEGDFDVTVQPGIGYLELNEALKAKELWFPLDPGPGASIGGMAACRCSGSTAVRYGTMRENVISLTVVMADGSVVKTSPRSKKSAAGYDLTRLMVGSEGTLGVITEATLKIYKIPKYKAALRCSFRDVKEASSTVQDIMSKGIVIGRAELMDDTMIRVLNSANGTTYAPDATVLFELAGEHMEEIEASMRTVTEIIESHNPTSLKSTTDSVECEHIWRERKEALWHCFAAYPDKQALITDVCVPVTKLADLISVCKEELDASPLPAPIVAHAGDGNFHALIMIDPESPEELREAERLSKFMVYTAQDMDGTCTGEHGIGSGKILYLEKELGESGMCVMRAIKNALDPLGILNPGTLLRDASPVLATKDSPPSAGCL